jgi:two-component system, OmpR family, sensor histidine kinase KdpD
VYPIMADQQNVSERRPSPDALLELARREDHRGGRLKVFVGAAPGVGKTYEMLQTARAKLKEGVDVVAGVVETHERKETEALLDGLEVLPRKPTVYVNRILNEFDIDAALKRRPGLILVDELAHTNIPGSRHPKRYMDVEELLNAGIDVYTTVNIQHIESLNDVVAQITRVRVRETVPDSILDRADDIELVDLTPDDLIQRLKEGKVYVPKQAERALKHYFSPANLTALRELALRRTADRVDEQLREQMQARAIPGPWPAGDRILVCVSEDPRSAGLVRYAKRLSDRLRAPWTALCIEASRGLSEKERDRIAETLRLAERLDGEAITIPAASGRIADDVLSFAQKHNVTHIIIGKSTRSRWFEILHGSVVHDLVRRAGNISVHVIPGEEISGERGAATAVAAAAVRSFDPLAYIAALLAVGVALGVGMALQRWFGVENVDLAFLVAIVGVAARYGLLPSLAATVAATLCYNFFFLPPIYTFTIADPANVVAFVFFAVTAVIVSGIAGRARPLMLSAQERMRAVESLYAFSRKLAAAGTLDDVLWATAYQTALMLKGVRVVLLLPHDGSIAVRAGYPPEDALDEADLAAARWAWQSNHAAGRDSDTLPGAKWLFLPMRTGRGLIGILGITRDGDGPLVTSDQRRLLDALIDQGALAIERVHLVEDIEGVKRSAETDRLRSALLTSISHDLKTPLAGILGAAGAMRDLSDSLDRTAKAELLGTVIDESERLNRFIANLLDMTKLEAGAVAPNAALHDLGEIVGSALQRAGKILAQHRVQLELNPDLPMVSVDAVLFEQVLFNLLDNAAKYAPSGTTIDFQAWAERDAVKLQIADEGDGIPPGDLERIFDKFYRVQKGDQVRAGTGLGLAISRGFAEALRGTITARNRTDRTGAVFTITLPVPRPTEQTDAAA